MFSSDMSIAQADIRHLFHFLLLSKRTSLDPYISKFPFCSSLPFPAPSLPAACWTWMGELRATQRRSAAEERRPTQTAGHSSRGRGRHRSRHRKVMKTGQGGSFVPPSVHLAKGTAVPVSSNGSLPSKARKQWSRSKIIWVLLDNVGPKSLKICQKTVSYIKLSEICPKCVRKVSEKCQKCVRFKIMSKMCQTKIRNVSEMYQK